MALRTGSIRAPELCAQQVEISRVTCGRSQCPGTVELANGRSTTISLTGRGLRRIVSGLVTAGIAGVQA